MNLNPTKLVLGLVGPFIAAGSGLLAAAAGKYGVHLDPSGINALGVAGATAGTAFVVKLIHDVEKDDPKAAAEVKAIEAQTEHVAKLTASIDPQIATAAKQAEQAVISKVQAVEIGSAEKLSALADAWPGEPPADPAPVPAPEPVAVAPSPTAVVPDTGTPGVSPAGVSA